MKRTTKHTETLTYLCVAPHYWGRGASEAEAHAAAARIAGRRSLRDRIVYASTDPEPYVDDVGYIYNHKPHAALEVVAEYRGGRRVAVGAR